MVDEQVETFLDVDTSGAHEPVAVEGGKEYQIRWLGGTIDTDKNGAPYFLARYEVPAEPYAKDFTDFFRLPHEGLSEKDMNRALYKLGMFKACFGLAPDSPTNLETDPPLEGWAILGARDDPEYGEQNTVRKYIAPK